MEFILKCTTSGCSYCLTSDRSVLISMTECSSHARDHRRIVQVGGNTYNYPSNSARRKSSAWHLRRKPLARSKPHPWRPLTLPRVNKRSISTSLFLFRKISHRKENISILTFFPHFSKTRKSLFHLSIIS